MDIEKKLKLYLDTSVFNFAVSTQEIAQEREITLLFFEEIKVGRFVPYVSDIVFEEIDQAPKKKQEELLAFMKQFVLESVPITEESRTLARRYLTEGVIPEKYENDALHMSIASVHNLDAIVSWNFEH